MNNIINNLKSYRIVNKNDYSLSSNLDKANKTIKELHERLNTETKINTNLTKELEKKSNNISSLWSVSDELDSKKLGLLKLDKKLIKSKKENNLHRAFSIISIPSTILVGYIMIQILIK